MADSPDTQVRDSLEAVLTAARQRLREAEEVAAVIPQLRSQIREVERSLARLDSAPAPRRSVGPTIREAILAYLDSEGGEIAFEPGGMLPMVHAAVGRHKSSVQVEIHRLEKNGAVIISRDSKGKPIGMRRARPGLTAIRGEGQDQSERELLQG